MLLAAAQISLVEEYALIITVQPTQCARDIPRGKAWEIKDHLISLLPTGAVLTAVEDSSQVKLLKISQEDNPRLIIREIDRYEWIDLSV